MSLCSFVCSHTPAAVPPVQQHFLKQRQYQLIETPPLNAFGCISFHILLDIKLDHVKKVKDNMGYQFGVL